MKDKDQNSTMVSSEDYLEFQSKYQKLQEAFDLQKEYIELLGAEINELASQGRLIGYWKSTRSEAGKAFRDKIAQLKQD